MSGVQPAERVPSNAHVGRTSCGRCDIQIAKKAKISCSTFLRAHILKYELNVHQILSYPKQWYTEFDILVLCDAVEMQKTCHLTRRSCEKSRV